MLRNLLAEIARKKIKHKDVAEAIGVTEKTLRNKLNGTSDFTVPEARAIKDTYFPALDLEYLFANSEDNPSEPKAM